MNNQRNEFTQEQIDEISNNNSVVDYFLYLENRVSLILNVKPVMTSTLELKIINIQLIIQDSMTLKQEKVVEL